VGVTQIIPVVDRAGRPLDRREQWNEDRAGRFVLVGLMFALAFLTGAAALWWASNGSSPSNEALANNASTISPVAGATIADGAERAGGGSTLPLSPSPVPAQGLVMSQAPQTTPAAQPSAPLATEAVAPVTTVAEATTTTTLAPTTTVAPTTTLAPSTTVPRTTVAAVPATSAPATTTTTTTTATTTTTTSTTTTTTTPVDTAPTPVVTSPAAADATLLDVVEETPDLSRVRELVEMSGFAPELDAARELTFLAPSNNAVDAWALTAEGQAVLADPDAVYDLLLRHLVPEAIDEATIFSRSSLATVSGAQLAVRQQSHTVDGADLLVVDVTAANGYLHVASDVLTGA